MFTSPEVDFTKALPAPSAGTLKGQTAVITGGASGIGLGIAKSLLAHGASVVLADFNKTAGEAAIAELSQGSPELAKRVRFSETDVTDYDAQVAAFRTAWSLSQEVDGYGHVDIVIPSAGIIGSQIKPQAIPPDADINEDPPKPNLKGLEVNLIAVYYTMTLAFHYFERTGQAIKAAGAPERSASLLFISSTAGYHSVDGSGTYSSSKYGVRGLFKSTRGAKIADSMKVRVNLMAPFWIKTPMTDPLAPFVKSMGFEFGEVADCVAGADRFLLDDTIIGRAMCIGVSGTEYGKEPGAFNFDLRDDPKGDDGGVSMWEHAAKGYLGSSDIVRRPKYD